MEENNNKNNKGLIIIVVVIFIACAILTSMMVKFGKVIGKMITENSIINKRYLIKPYGY